VVSCSVLDGLGEVLDGLGNSNAFSDAPRRMGGAGGREVSLNETGSPFGRSRACFEFKLDDDMVQRQIGHLQNRGDGGGGGGTFHR